MVQAAEITGVPWFSLDDEWERATPHLQRVIEQTGYTLQYIKYQLSLRNMQLWVWDKGAAVTQVNALPKYSVATIVLLAGNDMDEWVEDVQRELEDWARAIGCKFLELHGRKGWQRKLPDFRISHVTMSKEL